MKHLHLASWMTAAMICCSIPSNSNAQSRDFGAQRLLLDDGGTHRIRISIPSSGFPAPGIYDYVLPIPPAGITSGFVEAGTLANKYLQWNNASNYWQAVPNLNIGTGTQDILTKWNATGDGIINSAVSEDGSTVRSADRALLLDGTIGATPTSGPGTRMMWIPDRAAFRAGMVLGSEWDAANIGFTSVALGFESTASGTAAMALGIGAEASGDYSFATGHSPIASGDFSTAMGYSARAFGSVSLAIGQSVVASGTNAIALGVDVTASGNSSTALGKFVSTAGYAGSFIYGDASGASTNSSAANQFMVRSRGGFQLLTVAGGFVPDFSVINGALLMSGTTGATPASGAGTRMMWIPAKAAFRAGLITGGQWDDANVGLFSTATGAVTTASGEASSAMGSFTTASGGSSTAMGNSTIASGSYSTSMGNSTSASGGVSTALGNGSVASGDLSTAMGNATSADGEASTAMGISSSASGDYSTAMGAVTVASGETSTAMGNFTIANGPRSTSMGSFTSATGIISTAIGSESLASGLISTAMGAITVASGNFSTAMGNQTTASGAASIAMGASTTASGDYSTAMGAATIASGEGSTAMGTRVTTNSHQGSYIYGDQSSGATDANTADNQFMVRAAGGTVIYSSFDLSTGVTLAAGGNSWASISDSNRKTNRLNISGEDVLNKLSNIWLGSWNYKSQDKSTRHYGPMAQEFFAAFGNDGVGIIGNDTTLATADVDGVTLIAVKALIERNAALESRVNTLEAVIRKMASQQDPMIQKAMLSK